MKLPDGWRKDRLGDLVVGNIRNGYSPICNLRGNTCGWMLSLGALTPHGLDYSQRKAAPVDPSLARVELQDNDILISRSNTPDRVGMSSIFHVQEENYFYPDLMMRFQFDSDRLLPLFGWYFLNTPEVRSYFKRKASGTSGSMVKITSATVRSLEIPYPPLPEQRRIAEFLGTWDEAIEKLERLIAAEEAVLNAYLSRFVSAYESQNIPLGKLDGVKIEKGRSVTKSLLTGGNIPVIAGGKTTPYYCSAYTHDGETVTISASGAYAGYVWYHSGKIWASDCNVLTSSAINIKFIFFALKYQQQRIYSLQSGGAQPHVYAKDIEKILIPMLPRDKQDEIVKILSLFEQKALIHRQELAALQKQKRGLMQKLLTGTWRI